MTTRDNYVYEFFVKMSFSLTQSSGLQRTELIQSSRHCWFFVVAVNDCAAVRLRVGIVYRAGVTRRIGN